MRKLKEYAALGIPQYWIVEFHPHPKVHVQPLDDGSNAYRLDRTVTAGTELSAQVQADKAFTVTFDPAMMTEF